MVCIGYFLFLMSRVLNKYIFIGGRMWIKEKGIFFFLIDYGYGFKRLLFFIF